MSRHLSITSAFLFLMDNRSRALSTRFPSSCPQSSFSLSLSISLPFSRIASITRNYITRGRNSRWPCLHHVSRRDDSHSFMLRLAREALWLFSFCPFFSRVFFYAGDKINSLGVSLHVAIDFLIIDRKAKMPPRAHKPPGYVSICTSLDRTWL